MTKLATITSNLDITDEQIGAAHLVLHKDGNFYQVESAHSYDHYDVRYSAGKGFSCTCKSGKRGWSNVRHASGTCWHVRAAVACSLEVKAALAEQERLNAVPALVIDGQAADQATLQRVMSATPTAAKRGTSLPASRAFQLMR